MTKLDNLLMIEPYSLKHDEKTRILNEVLKNLSIFHSENCQEYSNILSVLRCDLNSINSYYDLPFLPTSLFKKVDLKSIRNNEIFKTITSSGTTGQSVSKIFLDKQTSQNQQKVLTKIISSYLGATRLPMLIIDSPSVIKDRKLFSVRGAGILGFSIFGTNQTYCLDDNMNIDFNVIKSFLDKHKEKKILIFGFTFMIWQYFYKELLKSKQNIDLSKAVLFHGGGWKKLSNEAVSRIEFKKRLYEACGISNIHDYYGMVEQAGSIYMECECGYMHTSNFSDIIIRKPNDFSICDIGQRGVIELVSVLPTSYPGHCILSEDEGEIVGIDDCPCGRYGKYFKIYGRIKNAEIRGCSDTYEKN